MLTRQVTLSSNDTLWNRRRIAARALTTSSNYLLNIFYAFFFYQSIVTVDSTDAGWHKLLITTLAGYLTITNFLADPPFINSVEESENILYDNEQDHDDLNTEAIGLSLVRTNKTLAMASSIILSADNAIAIAGLTQNNRAAILTLGIPFSILSIIQQYVVAKHDIRINSYRFARTIQYFTHHHSSWKNVASTIYQSPLKALEVAIQTSSNIFFQGIASGYVIDQLAKIFNLEDTHPAVVPWIFISTVTTAYVTAFLRVHPIIDTFFNPQYNTITPDELNQTNLPYSTLLLDLGITLTRTGALIVLNPLKLQSKILHTLLAAGISASTMHVLYQQHQYQLAVQNRESTDEIRYSALVEHHELADNPVVLFDTIAQHYETPALETCVTIINASARIGQLFSFMGFAADLLATIKIAAPMSDIVALGLLWGTQIVINEGKDSQAALVKSAAYHCAKLHIGAPTPAYVRENILVRGWAGFFHAKSQYSPELLRKAIRRLEKPGASGPYHSMA